MPSGTSTPAPSGYTRAQLELIWAQEAANHTLLGPKHDPNGPYQQRERIRSILDAPLSASLELIFTTGKYTADEYYNQDYQNYYYLVHPHPDLQVHVSGYFMLSGSQQASGSLDTLAIFSSSNQGWHVIVEESTNIQDRINNKKLVPMGTL